MTTSPGPPSPTSTRDRLIETARELFHAQGFASTGMAQLLRQAGVGSGSLYHFFRTKEDLLLAVLERYEEMLWPVLLQPVADRFPDPIERIFGLLDRYRDLLVESEFRYGCPIGNLALELDEFHPEAVEKVEANFAGWRDAVADWLTEAAPTLPEGTEPADLATFVLTVMEGGVMQSRTRKEIEPFDRSVSLLRDYLERLTRESEKGTE